MLTSRLLSTKKWWWNLRRSTWNDLPKLEGTHTHRVSFETAVARETCSWTELGGTRGWNSCEQVRLCAVHDRTTSFYWSSERMVALELYMDDIHGAATPSGREKVIKDLALEINSREVTDVRQESHTNISNDYDYR